MRATFLRLYDWKFHSTLTGGKSGSAFQKNIIVKIHFLHHAPLLLSLPFLQSCMLWDFPLATFEVLLTLLSPNICQILWPAIFPFCTISTQKLPPDQATALSLVCLRHSLGLLLHFLISPGKARGWSYTLSKGLIYPISSQETKLKMSEEGNTES